MSAPVKMYETLCTECGKTYSVLLDEAYARNDDLCQFRCPLHLLSSSSSLYEKKIDAATTAAHPKELKHAEPMLDTVCTICGARYVVALDKHYSENRDMRQFFCDAHRM